MSNIIEDNNILFDGDDKLFKKYVRNSKLYYEYGVGKSTKWVLENTKSKVIAVDSDKAWISKININNLYDARLQTIWVDLGELTNWGRPISYKKRDNFIFYISKLWLGENKPDLVLVDGRFRVACFLYSLLNSKINTYIFFDDYNNRPWYHIVEEIIPIHEKCGRQSVFIVPEIYDKQLAKYLFEKFIYVFD